MRASVNMNDVVIVGGGLHAVHFATLLRASLGLPSDAIRIVDPGTTLMSAWLRTTGNVGMSHLRSPLVHHLGPHPHDLWRFAASKEGADLADYCPPYQQPALKLFNAHASALVRDYCLDQTHVRATASGLRLEPHRVVVETDAGEFAGRLAVLALGMNEGPSWPHWALDAREGGSRVEHVFGREFERRRSTGAATRIVVVGGGISAVQLALAVAGETPSADVTLLMRHHARIFQFDADSGWLGPKYMDGFRSEPDHSIRREAIRRARHRGSVPHTLWKTFLGTQRVRHQVGEVLRAEAHAGGGTTTLHLQDASTLEADLVLLATGVKQSRPGGEMLDAAIRTHELHVSACGFPVVDRFLRWHPRLFVTGGLAELELGPTARNIFGAQEAGRRLVSAFGRELGRSEAAA